MYDELVKRLWECASGECFNCSQYTETTNASVCSKELMKQAADAIEELSKSRWISAEEMLPKDLQNVLVIDDGRVTIGHCEHYYGEEEMFVEWHDTLYYPIDTPYWQPLPEPPKEAHT